MPKALHFGPSADDHADSAEDDPAEDVPLGDTEHGGRVTGVLVGTS